MLVHSVPMVGRNIAELCCEWTGKSESNPKVMWKVDRPRPSERKKQNCFAFSACMNNYMLLCESIFHEYSYYQHLFLQKILPFWFPLACVEKICRSVTSSSFCAPTHTFKRFYCKSILFLVSQQKNRREGNRAGEKVIEREEQRAQVEKWHYVSSCCRHRQAQTDWNVL